MTTHYYSEKQDSELSPRQIKVRLLGTEIEFTTGSGVFSPDSVDKGTVLLIENCIMRDGWRVLDIGCGYGPVGIALAKRYDAEIVMTDINRRAVMLAKKNVKSAGVKVEVINSDIYEKVSGKFDSVLSNPPQHAGKAVCHAMIQGAKTHLKKGGVFQLVARHNKGGKTLSLKMEEVFGNVSDIAKKGGFRVYVSKA